jgi:hypothetical protein
VYLEVLDKTARDDNKCVVRVESTEDVDLVDKKKLSDRDDGVKAKDFGENEAADDLSMVGSSLASGSPIP